MHVNLASIDVSYSFVVYKVVLRLFFLTQFWKSKSTSYYQMIIHYKLRNFTLQLCRYSILLRPSNVSLFRMLF